MVSVGLRAGQRSAHASVYALAVSGANLYVGGIFTSAGGTPASSIANWDGSTWSPLGSGLDARISALAVSGTNLYVTGDFMTAGGITCNNIARWDRSVWSHMGSGLNFRGNALAVSGPDLYVGGDFDVAGGKVSARVAKANISPPSAPVIRNIGQAGANVVLRGTNGPAGAAYYVLTGTNVAQPRVNWTRLATNRFDAAEIFTSTNTIAPVVPQRFYSLEVP